MTILCIGVSHQTGSVVLRERLAFDEQARQAALAEFRQGGRDCAPGVHELAILSTCNRVEIYGVASHEDFTVLESFLEKSRGISRPTFSLSLYRYSGEEAVHHIFSVAAGLDSLILGEPQILGQVSRALEVAQSQGAAGKVLTRLFQSAVHAGKRARTETSISQNPATISSMAVRLITEIVGDVASSHFAVLGAGEMAELAVEALIKRGATQIYVVNRTLQRAQGLAKKWGGRPVAFAHLPEVLEIADAVIASTGAMHPVICKGMVEEAMETRPKRPLVIMDIAVPRNVDPQVAEIPGVTLYDMDALWDCLEDSLALRAREVPHVMQVIEEERAEFMKFLTEMEVNPLIAELRRQADQIRLRELEKTFRRMPDLTPADKERVAALTKSIVKKILHAPTACLRSQLNGPDAADYAHLTRQLFDLD